MCYKIGRCYAILMLFLREKVNRCVFCYFNGKTPQGEKIKSVKNTFHAFQLTDNQIFISIKTSLPNRLIHSARSLDNCTNALFFDLKGYLDLKINQNCY